MSYAEERTLPSADNMRGHTMPKPREWRWSNVPLPEAHLGLGALGLVLSRRLPRRITSPSTARRIGWPLVLAGVALAAWATRSAGEINLERPDRLVIVGPYAASRHPMYVAWTLIFLGIAFVANTVWLLLLLPPVTAFTHREVRHEENQLKEAFGGQYEAYRARVRRYL
jgi:protein-S-isoprenylcysteine O-methyltransferase Ste14